MAHIFIINWSPTFAASAKDWPTLGDEYVVHN